MPVHRRDSRAMSSTSIANSGDSISRAIASACSTYGSSSSGAGPQQHRVRRQLRLPAPATAAARHDRRQREHPLGVARSDRLADHAAHRDADDMGALDAEVIQQADAVARPCRRGHTRRGRGGAAAASASASADRRKCVERPVSRLSKRTTWNPRSTSRLAEVLAPADHLHPEPHHQQQRRIGLVAECLVAELDVSDRAEALIHRA